MSAAPQGGETRKTIDDALADIVAAAADRAAERVLHQATVARREVEQELAQFNAERASMIKEISLQVASASAKAELALAQHQIEEIERFRSVETQMSIMATQMSNAAASFADIAADVKSLLASRSFTQGAWKTLTVISTAIAGSIAAFVILINGFVRGKWPWSP
jgi:hypothetical protein